VSSEVSIVGESSASSRTTIRGGYHPILVIERVHTRIEKIFFDSPLGGAITVIASTGAEIVGNEVANVQGVYIPVVDATEGRGIKFLGNRDPEGAVTGHILIQDNYVHDLHADLSSAIVFDQVAADVTIAGNRLEDVAMGGVLAIVPGGQLRLAHNVIRPGPGRQRVFHRQRVAVSR
jgi:hypothetical protein